MGDDPRQGPGAPAVRQFLESLRRLSGDQWKEVITTWRTTVTDTWHQADLAVSSAVAQSERRQAREEILSEIGELTRRTQWERGSDRGAGVQAIESTAQYVASLAALALLVRDRITRQQFDALYYPFSGVVPLEKIESGA